MTHFRHEKRPHVLSYYCLHGSSLVLKRQWSQMITAALVSTLNIFSGDHHRRQLVIFIDQSRCSTRKISVTPLSAKMTWSLNRGKFYARSKRWVLNTEVSSSAVKKTRRLRRPGGSHGRRDWRAHEAAPAPEQLQSHGAIARVNYSSYHALTSPSSPLRNRHQSISHNPQVYQTTTLAKESNSLGS